MRKKRTAIITVALACIGIVLGIVFGGSASRESAPVPTAVVTRGDIVISVLVDGNLEMPNKAYLSFGITGRVTDVLVDKGSNVTEGQVLARLDAKALESSVEIAELQVEIAEAQVKAAYAQYQIAVLNLKNVTTPSQEKVLREQVKIAEANHEAARLSLEIAKLNLDSAKLNLKKAVIAAPFDGMVADITIIEGQELSAAALAAPAITLVDTSKIEMSGFIDELDIAKVKVGQAANITLDALPDEQVMGVVSFVSPVGTNRAGVISYATAITVNKTTGNLKDGMSATAEVIIDRRDNVLMIPNRAIQGTLDRPLAKVLIDGKIEEREITLGLTDGTNTEVLSGLEEGEKVILPTSRRQSYSFFDVDND